MEIHTHVVVRHSLMAFLENGILKEDLGKENNVIMESVLNQNVTRI